MEIHQLTQGFSHGDATSNMALRIQAILRAMGHESNIYSLAAHIGAQEKSRCLDHESHRARSRPDAALMYHFGTSSPLSGYYAAAPDRKVLVFHNVTPSRYFRAIRPDLADTLDRAMEELARLAPCTDLCCGISRYNLSVAGGLPFRRTMHLPGWADAELMRVPPSAAMLRQLRDGRLNLLFVGRVAPNKKIEDLVGLLRAANAGGRAPRARLVVAGTFVGMELYHAWLISMCAGLAPGDVVFTGNVSQAELNACYAAAGAFVCASEHEGFCIPLLEAAFHGVPVFAFDAPGVRETLGGSGVLMRRRDLRRAAELLRLALADRPLRDAVVRGQTARLAQFGEDRLREGLKAVIAQVAPGGPAENGAVA
jgi:glycosyltransferase involved in cell wall biosynthesis